MPVETGVRRSGPRTRGRSGGASPRGRIAELQRARLLAGAVLAAQELGWSSTTVAHITSRARVSRRTFYDLFEGREDCLRAVLGDVAERIEGEIAEAELSGLGWADRVRGGLLTILSFFDREPVLARVCMVQALQGGPGILTWREDILARLASLVDEGRTESARSQECTGLTAEGLVGAACAIVHARLLADKRQEPLTDLLGELMSLIVLPYQGPAAARRERRGIGTFSSGREQPAGVKSPTRLADISGIDPLAEIPMRLTYRTARVLDVVAEQPGASNRLVADGAGITDQGQVSKLLSRLQRLGLVANTGQGQSKGEPNAWTLTVTGERIANSLSTSTKRNSEEFE